MKKKNLFQKIAFTFVINKETAITTNFKAQDYEVFDGDKFSVMFIVHDNTAEDVKFASRGASDWADFSVVYTNNWEGKGTQKNCLFTFYVMDGKAKYYQIDYYDLGYIMVFQVDDNKKALGAGWKLKQRP